MRRGLLGGTFDPIHTGHLIVAEEVMWRLGLDSVAFIPTGRPWMKRNEPISSAEQRRAMVELAIAGNERFELLTLELERPGDTFTVDTVDELRAGRMAEDDLFFILGLDALATLHRWKEAARLLELAQIAVALRPGYGPLDLGPLEEVAPGARDRVVVVETPLIEISGTELRRRVAFGEPIRYLVPEGVRRYIEQEGLYLRPDGPGFRRGDRTSAREPVGRGTLEGGR